MNTGEKEHWQVTYLICSNLIELQEILSPKDLLKKLIVISLSSSSLNLFTSFLEQAKNIPFAHL